MFLRRTVLAGLVTVPLMQLPGHGHRLLSLAQVAEVAEDVNELDELAYRLAGGWPGPGRLDRLVAAWDLFQRVDAALASARVADRPRVEEIGARVACSLGQLLLELGQRQGATRFLGLAEELARRAQADYLLAYAVMLGCDVESSVQQGRAGPSAPDVRARLDRSRGLLDAGAPRGLLAWSGYRQAEELAAASAPRDEVEHAMEVAEAAWATYDGTVTVYGLRWPGPPLHLAFRANVALLGGQPRHTVEMLAPRLTRPQPNPHDQASLLSDLGTALVRGRELDAGCARLIEAWDLAAAHGLADRQERVRNAVRGPLAPLLPEREPLVAPLFERLL